MNTLDTLAHQILAALAALAAILLGLLDALEGALSHAMMQAGIPPAVRSVFFIVVAVLFLVAVLRVFGGLIRVGLILLLVVLLAHALSGAHVDKAL